jgi:hypothetical protein
LGNALVCGKKRVPKPAAAITAFLTFFLLNLTHLQSRYYW